MRNRIPVSGMLPRNYFFTVRDGDFQRGLNKAVANDWVTIDRRNRYRYQLTATGYCRRADDRNAGRLAAALLRQRHDIARAGDALRPGAVEVGDQPLNSAAPRAASQAALSANS